MQCRVHPLLHDSDNLQKLDAEGSESIKSDLIKDQTDSIRISFIFIVPMSSLPMSSPFRYFAIPLFRYFARLKNDKSCFENVGKCAL